MMYDEQNFPPGLATPTQIKATPTSKTVESTVYKAHHLASKYENLSVNKLSVNKLSANKLCVNK